MESSSPGAAIQHQAQDQRPDPPNPNSDPARYRNRNRPRPRVPPANADSIVTPPTDGTGTKPHQRNNRPRNREQGSSGPRNPSAAQAAGSSSVADGTYGADVRPPQTRRTRPPKRRQEASAANEPQVADSAPTQPKPTSQRPSRRSKFNTALSEPTPLSGDSQLDPQAHLPAQASSKPKRAKPSRSKAPPADDLTSTLIHALSTPPYPDCPICFNAIRPEQPTWSCSSSDPSENLQCCWTTFHLKCIRAWAAKSVKDLEEAWRTRGEERTGEWRCPGCQAKREQVPSSYWQVLLSTCVTSYTHIIIPGVFVIALQIHPLHVL
jgi:transcriptional repressor NF-X1